MTVECTHNYVTIDGAIHHNSAKTTAGLMKIAYEAARMAPCADGKRRSRAVVVRNTRQMLWDTTIKDFLKWFPDGVAGTLRKTDSAFDLRFGDVECEVLFRGLDDANDVRRLLSLQLSFGVIDEFKEVHPDIYEALAGRVGRYPDKVLVPPKPAWGVDDKGNPLGGCVDDSGAAMKKLWGMSNPPEADTWWEQQLTSPPNNMHVTIQPSGLSPEADWVHLLDSNYYENLAELHVNDPDWIDVFIHGKFGKSLQGQPVFRCFNADIHVSKNPLTPNRLSTSPVTVGFDCTGLNPAAVVGQLGFGGRLMVFKGLHALDKGPLRFMQEDLKPYLANAFPGLPVVLVIDPAGMNRESDERSVRDMLVHEGFTVRAAKTNNIAPRISAVESFMTRNIDGKPALVIDASCETLITALRSKYRYKFNKAGERDEKPEKTHPWADEIDSLQYLCLHADGGTLFGTPVSQARKVLPSPHKFA